MKWRIDGTIMNTTVKIRTWRDSRPSYDKLKLSLYYMSKEVKVFLLITSSFTEIVDSSPVVSFLWTSAHYFPLHTVATYTRRWIIRAFQNNVPFQACRRGTFPYCHGEQYFALLPTTVFLFEKIVTLVHALENLIPLIFQPIYTFVLSNTIQSSS